MLTRRLLQEARAVAAIDHPGICLVHDVGVDSTGRPYMDMQYVPGETSPRVVALSGYAIYKLFAADEDAPIIVRNGSMDVLAGKHANNNHRWKWNRRGGPKNPVFIHEPESAYGNDSFGALEVYVVAPLN